MFCNMVIGLYMIHEIWVTWTRFNFEWERIPSATGGENSISYRGREFHELQGERIP